MNDKYKKFSFYSKYLKFINNYCFILTIIYYDIIFYICKIQRIIKNLCA